jgi:hypothetical protein
LDWHSSSGAGSAQPGGFPHAWSGTDTRVGLEVRMSFDQTNTPPPGELESATDALYLALSRRDAARTKMERQSGTFGLALFAGLLTCAIAAAALVHSFDVDVFRARLGDRLESAAPSILANARQAAVDTLPEIKTELERTAPDFEKRLTDTVGAEATHVAASVRPLIDGNTTALTATADERLATLLLTSYPDVFKGDKAKARAFATALRAQEMKADDVGAPTKLSEPFTQIRGIQDDLRNMGTPSGEALSSQDILESLSTAAIEAIKVKLNSSDPVGLQAKPTEPQKKAAGRNPRAHQGE